MPTYSYYCPECGGQEIKQSIHDSPLTICPRCGRIGIVKKFSAVGISFKGKGFYSTDKKK